MSNLIVPLEFLPKVDVRLLYNYYYFHSFFVWSILAGLAAKVLYLRLRTQLLWTRCLIADATMNAISSILVAASVLPTWVALAFLTRFLNLENDDPVNWISLLVVIAAFGAVAEAGVLRFGFKSQLGKGDLWLLYAANVFCVAVGAFGLGLYEVAHPPVA